VDNALNMLLGVISILSAYHPNVAGQNVVGRAVGQAGEQQLLLSVVGKRQPKQLIAAFVIV
jgi:hypothetical protein